MHGQEGSIPSAQRELFDADYRVPSFHADERGGFDDKTRTHPWTELREQKSRYRKPEGTEVVIQKTGMTIGRDCHSGFTL